MGLSTVFDEVSQCLLRSSGYAVNLLVKVKLGLVLDHFELVVFDWVKKIQSDLRNQLSYANPSPLVGKNLSFKTAAIMH